MDVNADGICACGEDAPEGSVCEVCGDAVCVACLEEVGVCLACEDDELGAFKEDAEPDPAHLRHGQWDELGPDWKPLP